MPRRFWYTESNAKEKGLTPMLEISREHIVCSLSAAHAPAARCQSGETVLFHTRDCYNDEIRDEGNTLPVREYANPATGPLFVEGAEPGDILKVEILKIETDVTGVMRTAPGHGAYQHLVTERVAKIFPIEKGEILFDERLRIPADTMIGVIGTAPANGEDISTETPREHGGNMDCRLIVEGTTLYLPVNAPGALLAMGDLHAAMGDGETLICGMECRGRVTVRVTAVKGSCLPTPCLDFGSGICTIQSAETLDEASILASRAMHKYLMDCGLSAEKAGMILSLQGHLVICQIVDPLLTVRMELPRYILDAYGIRLP